MADGEEVTEEVGTPRTLGNTTRTFTPEAFATMMGNTEASFRVIVPRAWIEAALRGRDVIE